MANASQKNIAPDANPETDGKVPAVTIDPFSATMDALQNAGSARGHAVDVVCKYLSARAFDGNDASVVEAINGALKVAKLTKLAKIVSSVLNVIKIGGRVETPILNPIDYK